MTKILLLSRCVNQQLRNHLNVTIVHDQGLNVVFLPIYPLQLALFPPLFQRIYRKSLWDERRHISPFAVRLEMIRLIDGSPQHLVEADGRKVVMAIAMTFDLLPIAQFSSFAEMITAFNARLIGQSLNVVSH